MKKLILFFLLSIFTCQIFAQSKFDNVSKDLIIALKESKTGFISMKGKMLDEGEFKVKPNTFFNNGYIEFPSEYNDYVFYSQKLGFASNKKDGKKKVALLIDEAMKVLPKNYELTDGDGSELDYRVTRGYYGVYSPDKGQELLYVLHHPNDKKLNNNKYTSVVFSLNFRTGKSPTINMVVFSPSINFLENSNSVKAEILAKNFNYKCTNDVTIDWKKKQFQFEKNDNEWIDYYAVPFENGVYLDYSLSGWKSKVGIKSINGDNFIVDDGKSTAMDFFWMSYYLRDNQKKGIEIFRELLEVMEVPFVEQKYDKDAIVQGYDFTKFFGKYNGFIADVNTDTPDKSQNIKINIDIDFNVIISEKTGEDWSEIINTKLTPNSLRQSEETGRIYYVFLLEDKQYKDLSITINTDEIAKQLGGAVIFSLSSGTEEIEYFVANRKWMNPAIDKDPKEFIGEGSNQLIVTGDLEDNHPWESYWVRYVPELNTIQVSYKNVANYLFIKKRGFIYTIDLFKNGNHFDAEFHFIHGKVILEKMSGRIVIGDPTIKAYTLEDALHAMAKLYSEHAPKRTKHGTNFTIDYEEKESGVGIVLINGGHVFVGPYVDYNQANGKGSFYWASGKIERGTFIRNSREGWFDIKEKDMTSSGKYQNNTKEGTWTYKNTTYNKSKTAVYKNDKIIEETEWE